MTHRLGFLVSVCLLGAATVHGLTVLDGLGRKVELREPARKVVSLSPACTEILFALGAGDAVVGVTEYCDYPAEAVSKPKVGGFSGKTISIESIVSFGPDLVIAEGGMHRRVIDLLEASGIRCYAAEAFRLADAYRVIREIGTLVGRSADAERIAYEMRSRIDKTASIVAGFPRPSVFWIVWDDPLMTAGGRTFIADAIERAGGNSLFAGASEQYPIVSLEAVIAADPDWLLSGTDHGEKMNAKSLSQRNGWRSLTAVRENRIALIHADSINRAAPRLADAVEALARVLHPRAFGGGIK